MKLSTKSIISKFWNSKNIFDILYLSKLKYIKNGNFVSFALYISNIEYGLI